MGAAGTSQRPESRSLADSPAQKPPWECLEPLPGVAPDLGSSWETEVGYILGRGGPGPARPEELLSRACSSQVLPCAGT